MSKHYEEIPTLYSRSKKVQEDFELKAEKIEENKTVNIAIHDFTSRIDDKENKKKKIISPTFKVGDTSLTVWVYPEEEESTLFSEEYIAVYLHNEEKENVTATFTFKHASGVDLTHENRKIGANTGLGTYKFLSHEAYKEWAKEHGDVFKVEVDITLHVVKGPAQWTCNRVPKVKYDPVVEVSSYIKNNERLFTDFAILSKEGKEFPCHRFILSSQSQAMMAMFTTNMKEKKEGQVKLEYSDEVVEKFVDYFYTLTVPREVLKQNLDSFMTLSELYDLAPLKHQTEEVAFEQLTADNMVDMFVLSDQHNADSLKEASELFIKKNRDKLKELDLIGCGYPAKAISDILRLLV